MRQSVKGSLFFSPLLLLSAACDRNPPELTGCDLITPVAGTAIQLQTFAVNLDNPVYVTALKDDAERVFVVLQPGQILLFRNGVQTAAPFLDINERVGFGGERGLLSMALHPDFDQNGKFYVDYTDNNGDIQVSEFTAPDPAGDTADPNTEVNLLSIEHSQFGNHNGGLVKFGPDGFLYIGVGDGGSAFDPFGAGQRTTDNPATAANVANEAQLGKLLRIDANNGGVPAPGNPFGNEIYDFGLRNPWRFSFDRETGDLYIADVGQDAVEEIDFKAAVGGVPPAGTNWGWSEVEGDDIIGINPNGDVLPVKAIPQVGGICSVIGGYSYRGRTLPDLAGTYFYGDFCAGFIRTFQIANGVVTNEQDVSAALGGGISAHVSFGEDGCGELYTVSADGEISKIVPAAQ